MGYDSLSLDKSCSVDEFMPKCLRMWLCRVHASIKGIAALNAKDVLELVDLLGILLCKKISLESGVRTIACEDVHVNTAISLLFSFCLKLSCLISPEKNSVTNSARLLKMSAW